MTRWSAALCALLLSPLGLAAESPGRCAASASDMRALLEDVHRRHGSVGVQAAIVLDDRLTFSLALGRASLTPNEKLRTDTRLHVASVAKAFTGVAVLRAADQERLSLDAPIQAYAPTFPSHPHVVVTPRRLAAHRAGLKHWGPERDAFFARRFTLEEAVRNAGDRPFIDAEAPGFVESSYGYNLLGLAIQNAANTAFTEYVQREVIESLRLGRTRFLQGPTPEDGDGRTYIFSADAATPREIAPRDYSHSFAGGNMSSTAEDLARFGAGVMHPSFLSDAARKQLLTQPRFNGAASETSFGFSVTVEDGAPVLQALGIVPGVQAVLRVYPERRVSVAALSNSTGADRDIAEFTDALPRSLAQLCSPT